MVCQCDTFEIFHITINFVTYFHFMFPIRVACLRVDNCQYIKTNNHISLIKLFARNELHDLNTTPNITTCQSNLNCIITCDHFTIQCEKRTYMITYMLWFCWFREATLWVNNIYASTQTYICILHAVLNLGLYKTVASTPSFLGAAHRISTNAKSGELHIKSDEIVL